MRKKTNRSVMTMGITILVVLLFIWHFNRRFEQLKRRATPSAQPSSVTEQVKSPVTGTGQADLIEPGQAKRPILACFCAKWRYGCDDVGKLLDKIKSRFDDKVRIRMIDPADDPELAKQFRINNLPTFIIFDAQGKLVLRSERMMTEEELLAALSQAGLTD